MKLIDSTLKSKTFWTGVAAVATAGAGYASGQFTAPEALQIGFDGAMGVFLRMALPKLVQFSIERKF